jgi:hypothetical protein
VTLFGNIDPIPTQEINPLIPFQNLEHRYIVVINILKLNLVLHKLIKGPLTGTCET